MAKPKKRPSKNAKAAMKAVKESKLLSAKTAKLSEDGEQFKPGAPPPKLAGANKMRPDKKRG